MWTTNKFILNTFFKMQTKHKILIDKNIHIHYITLHEILNFQGCDSILFMPLLKKLNAMLSKTSQKFFEINKKFFCKEKYKIGIHFNGISYYLKVL